MQVLTHHKNIIALPSKQKRDFNHENGGNVLLQNTVGHPPNSTMSHLRTQASQHKLFILDNYWLAQSSTGILAAG
jgi:hypothetical protein